MVSRCTIRRHIHKTSCYITRREIMQEMAGKTSTKEEGHCSPTCINHKVGHKKRLRCVYRVIRTAYCTQHTRKTGLFTSLLAYQKVGWTMMRNRRVEVLLPESWVEELDDVARS